MRISTEPKPVSPLDEQRQTTMEARVTNCKSEPVYDKISKEYGIIAGPQGTEQGKTNPLMTRNFSVFGGMKARQVQSVKFRAAN